MAMGALLGNKQMQSTGQQLARSNTENYLDSVGEFKYIAERGTSGVAKGAENVVNALGYLGQMQNRAQVQQTAQTLGAWGALTGSENFKGASEHMDSYAQELKDTGLQDTAKVGTKYQQGIQERYADADITKTGKVLGDVSETVGGLAPSAVMNVIAPGSGIVVSALSAGGNATQEALANGASDHEALSYGVAVGTIEAATEKIFDGMAGLFGKGAADDVIESMAKKLAKREGAQNAVVKIANSLGEGMEEFISEVSTRVVNELIVDTDDRSFLQTMGDAGYSALMGAVVGGVVQTADGMINRVRSNPKTLAQQAADAAIAKFKAQTGAAAKPTLAQQIDSMRQQLMDMQRQRKVDALLAAYEKNVGPMESVTSLDEPVAVGYDKLNEGLGRQLPEGEKAKPGSIKLVVRDSKFEDFDGNVDWETWAPNGGRVPGTVQEGQILKGGTIIDRYGDPYGRYASPVGVPYEQRALPYVEDANTYHRYEVIKPIDHVTISQVAPAFEQPGGGIQYELPLKINHLIKEGYLREVTK